MSKDNYFVTHLDDIFKKTPIDEFFQKNKGKLSELPKEVRRKLLNDIKFHNETGTKTNSIKDIKNEVATYGDPAKKIALKGIDSGMTENKITKAYPNFDEYISHPSTRNTDKWIETVKNMYHFIHQGASRAVAFNRVTAGWDEMEKKDFTNWLKFYEANAHNKYSSQVLPVKMAQLSFLVDKPGYFMPVSQQVGQAIDFARDPENNSSARNDEKREIIEKQRNKIVSRLDSAEKLLRSQEGQMFAGEEFETLMHIIYELKKKIHTVNKMSTATRLYEDMIIREANILTKKGFTKASEILFKVADGSIAPAEPSNPTSSGGLPGTLPGSAPGQAPSPNNTPSLTAPLAQPEKSEGMKQFLDGLNGDTFKADDLEVIEDDDNNLVVEAQAAPSTAPETIPPTPESTPAPLDATPSPPNGENIEIEEDQAAPAPGDTNVEGPQATEFDQKFDAVFQGLTVDVVVQKLEDLTKIYKTRQLARELTKVDMMLNQLGLASFFPTLAEAINRSFDSNQYILSRLEDITARLRGTVQTNNIDLKKSEPAPSSPELDAARNRLQNESDKDKARKELKKQKENAEIDQQAKPEPELEVEEDLGGPVQTPAAPAPVTPVAPAVR